MAGEKTEKATSKRKEDERKKGNVFLSKEIVTVASLLAAFAAFRAFAPLLLSTTQSLLVRYLSLGATQIEITPTDLRTLFIDGCIAFAKGALPLLVICTLTTIIITMAQTKMLFSSKAFQFKGNRMDPIKGFQKLFAMRSFVELIKSMLKITVILYIIYDILKEELLTMTRLMDMTALQAMVRTGDIIWTIALRAGLIFAFLGAADYFYQWWEYEKNLRMSKQEIKDEYKQMEGDPQIKGHIRNMQQQRARKRMMQNVPSADVIIRNPTHYAVAIRYDQSKNNAPMVIAKGADLLALRIIAVAEENGVPITENKPLARALFEAVPLDREIPGEFYEAIAELLAYVYSTQKKGGKSG